MIKTAAVPLVFWRFLGLHPFVNMCCVDILDEKVLRCLFSRGGVYGKSKELNESTNRFILSWCLKCSSNMLCGFIQAWFPMTCLTHDFFAFSLSCLQLSRLSLPRVTASETMVVNLQNPAATASVHALTPQEGWGSLFLNRSGVCVHWQLPWSSWHS